MFYMIRPDAVLVSVLCLACGCNRTERLESNIVAPPNAVAFSIHLEEGFGGSIVTIAVDGSEVFNGKPNTDPVLGLAEIVPTWAASSTPVLHVTVKTAKVDWTEAVDLKKGKALGLSIISGKINMQQAEGFGYD